jgi:hypothetical protein
MADVAPIENTDDPSVLAAAVVSHYIAHPTIATLSPTPLPEALSYVPDDVSFINVGGDIFAMKENVPAIPLLYQDYKTFKKTFQISLYPNNVVHLLSTYMRWNGWNNSFTFANDSDKNGLMEVFRIRMDQLTKEIQAYGMAHPAEKGALFLSHKRKVIARLRDLRDTIKSSAGLTITSLLQPRDQYLLLLEVAWKLSQPSDTLSSTWKYHLDAIHRLRLQELPQEIRAIQDQSDDSSIQPRTIFSSIPAPNTAHTVVPTALQNRIKALLTILHVTNALESDDPATNGMNNSASMGVSMGASMGANNGMSGGSQEPNQHGRMDHLFRHAMLPLFDHFRVMFDPIYSMLESHLTSASSSRLFSSLSLLFYMCHHLHRRSSDRHVDCVYRVHHLPPIVMSFFQEQLRGTRSYVNGLTPSKKREFVQQLSRLPAVRLSSLKAGHTSFQFYLLNENMTLPTAQEWVDPSYSNRTSAIHESLSEFFTDRHLYVVCGGAHHVPLRIRDVDGRSLRKDDVRVDPLYSHRLNRTPLFMDEVFTFDPHVLYLDTELVLSMLLVSKDQLSS